jgi:hypothetical protein
MSGDRQPVGPDQVSLPVADFGEPVSIGDPVDTLLDTTALYAY